MTKKSTLKLEWIDLTIEVEARSKGAGIDAFMMIGTLLREARLTFKYGDPKTTGTGDFNFVNQS